MKEDTDTSRSPEMRFGCTTVRAVDDRPRSIQYHSTEIKIRTVEKEWIVNLYSTLRGNCGTQAAGPHLSCWPAVVHRWPMHLQAGRPWQRTTSRKQA